MMRVRVVSRWKSFDLKIRRGQARNCNAAAYALREAIRADISTPVFPRSSPGEAPHMETGALVKSYRIVLATPTTLVASVGSDLPYSLMLEDGTVRMAARPHIRRNLYGNPVIPQSLCRPI